MKKINKTVLLASTLFITSAINLADNAYANEDNKSLVKESVDKISEDNEGLVDKTQEIKSKSYNNLDFNEVKPSADSTFSSLEKTDKDATKALDEAKDKSKDGQVDPKAIPTVENGTPDEKRIPGIIYYDNRDLDEALKEEKSLSSEVKDLHSEQSEIEEENYYTGSAGGYFVKKNNRINYYINNKLVRNANVKVNGRIYRADKFGTITNPRNKWLNIGKDIYYNNKNGNILKGINQIGKFKFCFSQDGILERNKKVLTKDSYYEVDKTGRMKTVANKWVNVNNDIYRVLGNGKVARGVTRIGNNDFMFDNDGKLQTNKKMIVSNKYYEVNASGIVTNPKSKWFALDGQTYWVKEDGTVAKGAVEVNGNTYVFNYNTGAMIAGRPSITNGQYYITDEKGISQIIKDSWVTFEGKTFHTNESGYIQKGLWEINGNLYCFDNGGLLLNSTYTQNGIIYKTDEKGIARIAGYTVVGDKDIDCVMQWMFDAKNKRMTYNMGRGRVTEKSADCSSAVFRSLIYGGFLKSDAYVGNTETLFSMGDKGEVMYEIGPDEIDYGDIFVAGVPGKSLGEGGHTGFILNKNEDTIIHMNYSGNGVSITPRIGNMGDKSGRPVKYFRLVGSKSDRRFVDKK